MLSGSGCEWLRYKGLGRSRRSCALTVVAGTLLVLTAQAGAGASPEIGDACAWQPGLALANLDNRVIAMAVFDDGTGPTLYAGGLFTTAGGVTVNHIARWDGSAWSALSGPGGAGVNGFVHALEVFDDGTGSALYAGGDFTSAGGVTVNHIARWDGSAWSALSGSSGTGVNDRVRALEVFDDGTGPALHAGGDFTSAGGVTVNHIARWVIGAWSALSGPSETGVDDLVSALAVWDDGSGPVLYAGGSFVTAGGVTANYVARWDGSAWSALSGPSATGMVNSVLAFAVVDDGSGPALYAGGAFLSAGGATVYCVARWDGSVWSALSGPSGTGVTGVYAAVYSLAVLDDGTGPALYAGGWFDLAGGVEVNNVARWDGTAWSALGGPSGTGVEAGIYVLGVHDDGSGPTLFAGGIFTTAGGLPSNYIAAWRCAGSLFADNFETGDTTSWSSATP